MLGIFHSIITELQQLPPPRINGYLGYIIYLCPISQSQSFEGLQLLQQLTQPTPATLKSHVHSEEWPLDERVETSINVYNLL